MAAQIPFVLITDAKGRHHLLLLTGAFLLAGLWTAAIVVWTQRWAWAIFIIIGVLSLIRAPIENGLVSLAINLVTLALVLSPGMLCHMGFQPRFPRRKGPLTSSRAGARPT